MKWACYLCLQVSTWRCSLGKSSWAPAFCSKSLIWNEHAICAFRYPPGGVALERLLDHQDLVVKSLVWNESCYLCLQVSTWRCSLGKSSWAPAFCSKSLVWNEYVICALRYPPGGVAWESLLEHQHFVVKALYEINILFVPSGIHLEV